jgi:endoglucanase
MRAQQPRAFVTRRVRPTLVALAILLAPFPAAAQTADTSIRLDTVGYLPAGGKRASVAARFAEFKVVSEPGGAVVSGGKASGPRRNEDTGEDIYVADFSALRGPGTYRLEIPGVGRSAPFRVAPDVYVEPFRAAFEAMHLWRCGSAVRLVRGGATYSHAACHLEDARLDFVGSPGLRRDAAGGWHDAGDYNKYVVNAGVAVGILLRAWEDFGPSILRVSLDLPREHQGLPAYLNEIRWELDWLLKMQAADGSVYHKISTKDFGPALMPEDEKTERYFTPWGSAATADFAAVLAAAARAFRPYDRLYARRCLAAARRAYEFLRAHPADHRADLAGFTTGAYQTDDADDRLWAAAELWETTGERTYLMDFERRARAFREKFDVDWGWSNVKNLGMTTYLASGRAGRDATLARELRGALIATADRVVALRDAHGYARPLGTKYYWGANGGVANTVVLLQAARRVSPKLAYAETALDALHNLFGRNPYGRSFVTGVGHAPPLRPHDRRWLGRPALSAWPGYLVGGGWPKATDWVDDEDNYRVNEIAINWNAPLVYALAGFLDERRPPRRPGRAR